MADPRLQALPYLIAGPEPRPRDPMRDAVLRTAPPTEADAFRALRGFLTRGTGMFGGPKQPGQVRPAEAAGRRAGTAAEIAANVGTGLAGGLAALLGSPRALALARSKIPPMILQPLEQHPNTVAIADPVTRLRLLQIFGGTRPAAFTTTAKVPELNVPPAQVTMAISQRFAQDPRVWGHEGAHAMSGLYSGGKTLQPDLQSSIRIIEQILKQYPQLNTPAFRRAYAHNPRHMAVDLLGQYGAIKAGMPYESMFGESTGIPPTRLQLLRDAGFEAAAQANRLFGPPRGGFVIEPMQTPKPDAGKILNAVPGVKFKGTTDLMGKQAHWYDVETPVGGTTAFIYDDDLQAGKLAERLRETYKAYGMTPPMGGGSTGQRGSMTPAEFDRIAQDYRRFVTHGDPRPGRAPDPNIIRQVQNPLQRTKVAPGVLDMDHLLPAREPDLSQVLKALDAARHRTTYTSVGPLGIDTGAHRQPGVSIRTEEWGSR